LQEVTASCNSQENKCGKRRDSTLENQPSYKPLDARIQRALDLIHYGPRRQLTVSELARQVGLSESHFHHLFRREIAVSPAKYIDNLMLRDAEHLIKTTVLSVKDIFSIVGVTDRSHFVRKFRQAYGLSPSRYRIRKAGRDSNSQDGVLR
jgi:transcriptional regulator GlxA family with amidase domain